MSIIYNMETFFNVLDLPLAITTTTIIMASLLRKGHENCVI
jgi:hypothetical protein